MQAAAVSLTIIVTGSRKWPSYLSVWQALARHAPDLVVHGGCPLGADDMAELWCRRMQVDSYPMRAKWGARPNIDRSAGVVRNERMLCAHPLALVLAFPFGGPGTADCIRRAQKKGMRLEVIEP